MLAPEISSTKMFFPRARALGDNGLDWLTTASLSKGLTESMVRPTELVIYITNQNSLLSMDEASKGAHAASTRERQRSSLP